MLSPDRNTTRNFLWISLVLFIILILAFLLPVDPNDYWWYLRLGKDTITQGSVPLVDTYSSTQAGQPIFYPAWLSALIFYILQLNGDLTLTILERGVLVTSFYLFLWLSCWEMGGGTRLTSSLVLLAALAGSANWAVRPQLFAYPLFGLTLWLLLRYQHGKMRGIWLLPVIAGLWANLHGSFILFFALVGAAAVGTVIGNGWRKSRGLFILLGISFLATFINPRGPSLWWLSVQMISNPSIQQFCLEWAPPANTNWQMNLFFAWLLFFPLLAVRSTQRLNTTQWLWFLGIGWLGLSSLRHVIWFLFMLALTSSALLAPLLNPGQKRPVQRTYPLINLGLGIFLLLSTLTFLPSPRQMWWSKAPPVLTANTPVAAVNWLKSHPELPNPLWSDVAFASYLIYTLPERQVWIDTRFDHFPVAQWNRYLVISDGAPGWDASLAEEGVRLLLLDPTSQAGLIQVLAQSPQWQQVYRDTNAQIYVYK